MNKLNRFKPWVNTLEVKESDAPKITDVKQNVSRIEFKDKTPFEKVFDCRVLQRTRPVTKGYVERKKLCPVFDAFGVGKGNDNLRMNTTITMNMRDNIWHPHYEIKVEEENIVKTYRTRLEANQVVGEKTEISNLEKELTALE